jgi:hypothetical protein
VIVASRAVRLEYRRHHFALATLTPAEIDMSPRRALSRSLGAALATVMATGATLLPPAASTPAIAAPPYTLEERAAAIASPSLVFIEVKYEGFVYLHATGKRMQETPTVFYLRCSGVAVQADGYVLTESDCVRPNDATLRVLAGFSVAGGLVDQKKLTPDKISQYANDLANKSNFAGTDQDTRPVATIHGQLFAGTSLAVDPPAMPGEIVYATGAEETNLALIKFSGGKLPVAQVSGSAPASGSSAVALGYATADADANHATFLPKSQAVQITGSAEPNGLRISGDVGPYSRGGAVVDDNGLVTGVIQLDPQSPQGLNRAVGPSTAAADVLAKAGVQNALGSVDQAYRAGLDDYFAGRYTEAIKKFDGVLAAMPSHRLATTYRQQAVNRIAIEGESSWPTWLIVLAAALGGIVLFAALGAVFLYLGRRRRGHPDGSMSPAPVALNPFAPTSGYPASSPPMSPMPIPTSDPYGYGAGPTSGTPLTINPAPHGMPVPFPPPPLPPAADPGVEPAPDAHRDEPQDTPASAEHPGRAPEAAADSAPDSAPPATPIRPVQANPPQTTPPQTTHPTVTAADFAWPEDGDYDDSAATAADNPWAPPPGQR